MKCWNMEHSNDTVIASINIIRCFKDTWFNFAFQDCIEDVNSWFHEEESKESRQMPDFGQMRWVNWCMTKTKREIKVS